MNAQSRFCIKTLAAARVTVMTYDVIIAERYEVENMGIHAQQRKSARLFLMKMKEYSLRNIF